VTSFKDQEMDIKIDYNDPNSVSTFTEDQLVIKFPLTKDGESILKPYVPFEVSVNVPKQMTQELPDGECDYVCSRAGWVDFFTWLMLIVCVPLSFYSGEPLRFFWSWFCFLQLLVHLPLLGAPLP